MKLALVVAGLALAVPAAAQPTVPPRPERHATDRTGRLEAARLSALSERLAEFERQTSTQVLVYVDGRLPEGTTLEEFAARAFGEWGVGQKGRDNGAVFLAFLDDRVMRLEVGYGLEGAIPDARARRITDEAVKPRFKAGDYAGGVEAAAAEILAAARGEPFQGSGRTVAEEARVGLFEASSPAALAAGILFYAAFAGVIALLFGNGLLRSWRSTKGKAALVRVPRRAGVVVWALLVLRVLLIPLLGGPPGWHVVAALELALGCRLIAVAAGDTGGTRIRRLLGTAGFMVAAWMAPQLFAGGGGPTVARDFVAGVGSLLVGIVASVVGTGFAGSGSGSRSWSGGSSSSRSSWSSGSSSRSSSSSFSGGGGRSGGGGSSSSW